MLKTLQTLLFILICYSCGGEIRVTSSAVQTSNTPLNLNPYTDFQNAIFDSATTLSYVTGTAVDEKNNIYIFGAFTGSMDGIPSDSRDLYLVKLSSSGNVIWKRHFRSGVYGINDASLIENADFLIYHDGSLYLLARTKSPYIEGNGTGTGLTDDIIVAKVSTEGNVNWVKHYGGSTQEALKTSLGNPSIDFSQDERAGSIQISPAGDLVITFQTKGSLFEVSAGKQDVGVIKINKNDGAIISGRQLGSVTLAAYGTQEGITVNGGEDELIAVADFGFDGDLIVVPMRTNGSLVEVNLSSAVSSDAGYFILDKDLYLMRIKQLGVASYNNWVNIGNYAGSTDRGDQYRSVIMNAPGDYLFFGKSEGSLGEAKDGSSDYLFVRYVNHEIYSIIQYGLTNSPMTSAGTNYQEPRRMIKDSKGRIFCSGHTNTSLFEEMQSIWNPTIFRVDINGNYQNGIQLGAVTAPSLGFNDQRYNLVQEGAFVVKGSQLLIGTNNDLVTSGSTLNAKLFSLEAP